MSRSPIDPEQSLAIRAAWLHYAGGLTQAAVAKRLGVPSVKAHRLIARAVADGVVIGSRIIEEIEQSLPEEAPQRVATLLAGIRKAMDEGVS
jgi:DNA-binding transcriptional regulator LsrR (DeoR family)